MMRATTRLFLSRKAISLFKHSASKPLTYSTSAPQSHIPVPRAGFSVFGQSPNVDASSSSMFSSFSIFKGKAALFINPVLPKFVKKDSGVVVLQKNGSIMLKFMPAIGQRKYDSSKKQLFALSPTEVGCMIGLGPGESCDLFHDPSMKSSLEGQVKKTLNVTPVSSEDGGYFFSLTVNNSILKTNDRISLPVSKAEFTVMRTSFSYILPHIMGWDRVVTQQPLSDGTNAVKQAELRINKSTEWDR